MTARLIMSTDGGELEAVTSAADRAMRERGVPGMAVAVARGGLPARRLFLGADAEGAPLDDTSLFAVASITKLATALAVLRLVDDGRVELDKPVTAYLAGAGAGHEATIRSLMSHTSGLPLDLQPNAAPYQSGLDWPTLARACVGTPRERPAGKRVQYSNVGYGLLAVAVERVTGQRFAASLRDLVLEPLGVEGYLGEEPPREPARVADVRSKHAETPLEPYNSAFWRSLALPWGGLVTTLDGALALVRAFAGEPADFLSPELRREATSNQAGDLEGGFEPPLMWRRSPWGLGPELRDDKRPHWAPATAATDSFGHSGASGCYTWHDPARAISWAIIGTRTADNGWLVRYGPQIGAAILADGA